MASITTRETGTTGTDGVTRKDLPLTNAEIDQNFINLNNTIGTTNVTTLGTVTTGTWSASTVAVNKGGTGQTSYTNGQLLIGNTTGNTLTKTTLTAGTGVTITNGTGSITIATGQDINTTADVQFKSLGVGTAASGTTGEIRATGEFVNFYSDERLKENIEVIPNALDKVLQLKGVTYNPNQLAESFGFINKGKQVGVLAGDVEKVLPEAVKSAPFDIMLYEDNEISRSGENYKTVQYEKLVPLLIEAIKELNNQIKDLKGIK
jgi:hypothetical protein